MKNQLLSPRNRTRDRLIIIAIRITVIVLLQLMLPFGSYAQCRISGIVMDSITHDPLPFVSVRLEGSTEGCQTDHNGTYAFLSFSKGRQILSISFLGYTTRRIDIDTETDSNHDVYLAPVSYELDEVVIGRRNERYRWKGNEACNIVRELILQCDSFVHSPYTRMHHEVLSIAVENLQPIEKFAEANGLYAYLDTSLISNRPMLNVSVHEALARELVMNPSFRSRRYVIGTQRYGFDDFLDHNEIDIVYERTFCDIDLADDGIELLHHRFTSPLASIALAVYKYFITDTIDINHQPCIDIFYAPFNDESPGFIGHLYVTVADHRLVRAQLSTPKELQLNFLSNMTITQDYLSLPDIPRPVIAHEELICEMGLLSQQYSAYIKRTSHYSDFSTSSASISFFDGMPSTGVEAPEASSRSEAWWNEHRIGFVNSHEFAMKEMMDTLRSNPNYYRTEQIVKCLYRDNLPIPLSRGAAPILFTGPISSLLSSNTIEGQRIRIGAATSAYLMPRLFAKTSLAYGTFDKRLKYHGELEYAFAPKQCYPTEFPIRSVKLNHENDLFLFGQDYVYSNQDNIFLSARRIQCYPAAYQRKWEGTFQYEWNNHLSLVVQMRHRTLTEFINVEHNSMSSSLEGTESEFQLRFAPGEKFQQKQWARNSLTPQYPVFALSHVVALKGFLHSNYSLKRTDIKYIQRYWLNRYGCIDNLIKWSKVWNTDAPDLFLVMPNANPTYVIQPESFALLNPMEFVGRSIVTWDTMYHMNGLLCNRIPLLQRSGLREVVGCRGFIDCGQGLKEPYVEYLFGLENILHILELHYVVRATDLNIPQAPEYCLQAKIHIQF